MSDGAVGENGSARVPSQIEAAEAIVLAGTSAWLLDVREQHEWDSGHARGAHLIPMSVIEQRVGEIPEDQPILVICQGGYRSWQVTKALVVAGFDATNVAGGMDAWQSAGGVVVTDGSEPSDA
jgi:rhodanese-related sulfurtransferase